VFLYLATVFWTMGYDTIYAIQDIEDDALAGIRSTALMFGASTQTAVAAFYGITVGLTAVAFTAASVGVLAWLGVIAFGVHLMWQVSRIDILDGQAALVIFQSNRNAGLILLLGVALDAAVRHFGA
jgi:4-hydroxybenzoate polyprenyltransferase